MVEVIFFKLDDQKLLDCIFFECMFLVLATQFWNVYYCFAYLKSFSSSGNGEKEYHQPW